MGADKTLVAGAATAAKHHELDWSGFDTIFEGAVSAIKNRYALKDKMQADFQDHAATIDANAGSLGSGYFDVINKELEVMRKDYGKAVLWGKDTKAREIMMAMNKMSAGVKETKESIANFPDLINNASLSNSLTEEESAIVHFITSPEGEKSITWGGDGFVWNMPTGEVDVNNEIAVDEYGAPLTKPIDIKSFNKSLVLIAHGAGKQLSDKYNSNRSLGEKEGAFIEFDMNGAVGFVGGLIKTDEVLRSFIHDDVAGRGITFKDALADNPDIAKATYDMFQPGDEGAPVLEEGEEYWHDNISEDDKAFIVDVLTNQDNPLNNDQVKAITKNMVIKYYGGVLKNGYTSGTELYKKKEKRKKDNENSVDDFVTIRGEKVSYAYINQFKTDSANKAVLYSPLKNGEIAKWDEAGDGYIIYDKSGKAILAGDPVSRWGLDAYTIPRSRGGSLPEVSVEDAFNKLTFETVSGKSKTSAKALSEILSPYGVEVSASGDNLYVNIRYKGKSKKLRVNAWSDSGNEEYVDKIKKWLQAVEKLEGGSNSEAKTQAEKDAANYANKK